MYTQRSKGVKFQARISLELEGSAEKDDSGAPIWDDVIKKYQKRLKSGMMVREGEMLGCSACLPLGYWEVYCGSVSKAGILFRYPILFRNHPFQAVLERTVCAFRDPQFTSRTFVLKQTCSQTTQEAHCSSVNTCRHLWRSRRWLRVLREPADPSHFTALLLMLRRPKHRNLFPKPLTSKSPALQPPNILPENALNPRKSRKRQGTH